MKREKLSFVLACLAVLIIFVVNQSLSHGRDKAAYASPSEYSEANPASAHSDFRTRGLRSKIMRDPRVLLELKGADVERILSTPELTRQDLPTVVWQYRTDSCVLDLYFTSGSSNVSKSPVVHYELRARDAKSGEGDKVNASACVQTLAQRAGGGGNLISLLDARAFYKSENH